jgi:hypothetical protein
MGEFAGYCGSESLADNGDNRDREFFEEFGGDLRLLPWRISHREGGAQVSGTGESKDLKSLHLEKASEMGTCIVAASGIVKNENGRAIAAPNVFHRAGREGSQLGSLTKGTHFFCAPRLDRS